MPEETVMVSGRSFADWREARVYQGRRGLAGLAAQGRRFDAA
jgi:hypothetical protein